LVLSSARAILAFGLLGVGIGLIVWGALSKRSRRRTVTLLAIGSTILAAFAGCAIWSALQPGFVFFE